MKFVTLGPTGSCHENALIKYLNYHGVKDYQIIFIDDYFEGLDMIYHDQAAYLVQCSAHPLVHQITEKYHEAITITDTFIYPTKELVLLEDVNAAAPATLGLVKATEGYLQDIHYPAIVYESSKPVVGANLLAGKYPAGLTHIEYYQAHPQRFRIRKYIGQVLTTWLVYGKHTLFNGTVMGVNPRGYPLPRPEQASTGLK